MTYEIELLPPSKIRNEITRRMSDYVRERIPAARQAEYEADGWVLDKKLKSLVWMRKRKRHDVAFEDRVWAMCARLGFTQLSPHRSVRIPYGDGENERKQVDVFAADNDVVLVIECKSSEAEKAPTHAFKTEIESIQGYRAGLIRTLRAQFPDHKVRFVFATNNINATPDTLGRIENAQISYMDEEAVDYYHELATHLGNAAKFQLLGNLFSGQQIMAMDAVVPAIQGKMGGYLYYSFAIEPERLLKIAYVLHRNNANLKSMPTYQRIIKRTRLKRVSEFVDKGGFFPNALIINVENGGKRLKFDRTPSDTGASTLGLLHLPRKYRSAFVIDGQHRLYGFANSERAATELVPVVAFVDLPGPKQLDLFMQINENQQAVPKNLRSTLNADLLWNSPDRRRQAQALKLRVAQQLGEAKSSPLRGRIIVGEEQSNDRRCIGLEAISRGIDRGRFIGEFSSTEMKKVGSFYRGSNSATLEPLASFLELCFAFLSEELPTQWNLGRVGFLFTNAGVEALLRVIGDVVDHLVSAGTVDARQQTPSSVFVHVRPILQILTNYLNALGADEVTEFRGNYGSGAPTIYLRRFQGSLADAVEGFEPEGLREWQANQTKQFNAESYTMVHEIEVHLKADIKRRLEDKYHSNWFKDGVPQAVYQDGMARAAEKQWRAEADVKVDWWDCLYLIELHKVMLHGQQSGWMEMFDRDYTLPSDRKVSSWRAKSSWMNQLNVIRNKISHNESVSESEYEFLQSLYSWFELGGTGANE